jgi:hypothetical protein
MNMEMEIISWKIYIIIEFFLKLEDSRNKLKYIIISNLWQLIVAGNVEQHGAHLG